MSTHTTIAVSHETRMALANRQREGESLDATLRRELQLTGEDRIGGAIERLADGGVSINDVAEILIAEPGAQTA